MSSTLSAPQAERITEAELLLKVFPESRQIVPALITENEEHKGRLVKNITDRNADINKQSNDEFYRYFWKSWFIAPLRDEVKLTDQKLARLRRQLRIIKGITLPKGALTNEQIQAAKAVPIESIFEQNFRHTGNMLTGLCPFTEENTPSFFIYKNSNRCWCFGCQQGGNTIDTYIKLHGCSIKEAVLALLGE